MDYSLHAGNTALRREFVAALAEAPEAEIRGYRSDLERLPWPLDELLREAKELRRAARTEREARCARKPHRAVGRCGGKVSKKAFKRSR